MVQRKVQDEAGEVQGSACPGSHRACNCSCDQVGQGRGKTMLSDVSKVT